MLRDLTFRRFGFSALVALAILCGVGATGLCILTGLGDGLRLGGCRYPRSRAAQVRVKMAEDAIGEFIKEQERCPASVDELVEGDYLLRDAAHDPWGTRLLIECFVQ